VSDPPSRKARMPALDLSRLTDPVILAGTDRFGYRDPAVTYHQGMFYLYVSVPSIEADGLVYSRLGWSKSSDLVRWTPPVLFTALDRTRNYSSPGNVVRDGEDFVLCLQTYPTPLPSDKYANDTARIWTMRSRDLEHWDEPVLLRVKGPSVPQSEMGRMIDAFLLRDRDDAGLWWCFYKQNGVSLSRSRDLTTWEYMGAHAAGENACVVVDQGEYVLFSSPETGIQVSRSWDLRQWRDCGLLRLGMDQWPWAQGRLSAGFVLDLRHDPAVGKALLFFHGSRYPEQDPRGGWANFVSIGISWSDDLVTWQWPGSQGCAQRSAAPG
jgi:hypothetical protein